jgi:hypothetical protein
VNSAAGGTWKIGLKHDRKRAMTTGHRPFFIEPNLRSGRNHEMHKAHEINGWLSGCLRAEGFTRGVNASSYSISFMFTAFRVCRGFNGHFKG